MLTRFLEILPRNLCFVYSPGVIIAKLTEITAVIVNRDAQGQGRDCCGLAINKKKAFFNRSTCGDCHHHGILPDIAFQFTPLGKATE